MTFRRILLSLFFVLLACSPGLAERSSFQELVTALQSKDDATALLIARELEQSGEGSFGLYYNKGLAERNLGQFARSRASFEKALLYSPRDLDTRRRLREVKEKLNPQLAKFDTEGTPPWSREEAEVLLALLTLSLLLLGVLKVSGQQIGLRRILPLALLLTGSLLVLALNNPPSSRAVLVTPGAKLLSEAKGDSSGQAIVEGVLLEVTHYKGHFVKVKTGDGREGWLRQGQLEAL